MGGDPILSASPGQGINPENRRRRKGLGVRFGPWIVGWLRRINNPGDILGRFLDGVADRTYIPFSLKPKRLVPNRCGCGLQQKIIIRFLGSSMVEHSAVNRNVVGSSPTRGASFLGRNFLRFFWQAGWSVFFCVYNPLESNG